MDNRQQITDAEKKGLYLIVPASVQQGRTRLTRLHTELYNAVLAFSCGPAKCCITTMTVAVFTVDEMDHVILNHL